MKRSLTIRTIYLNLRYLIHISNNRRMQILYSRLHHFYLQWILISCVIVCLVSCRKVEIPLATQACQKAQVLLKNKIGPEFGKLIQAIAIPIDKKTYGCALRFTRIAEELPGEVMGSYKDGIQSEELAMMLKDPQNRSILTIAMNPTYRTTNVVLSLKLKDVQIGAAPELLVFEKPRSITDRYQALRIFNFAKGVPIARELFSKQLILKTPEGLEVIPKWEIENFEEKQAIVMKGGGEYRVFMWHDGIQRFKLDLAASQRRKMKTIPSQNKKIILKDDPSFRSRDHQPADATIKTQSDDNTSKKTSVKDLLNTL
jgi:hypothetical protein